MSIETIKGKLIELTYDNNSFKAVRSEIQLGDCLYAKFDELATFSTYKYLQHWANSTDSEEPLEAIKLEQADKELSIPRHLFDLAPAMVFIPRSRVRELFADFENVLAQVNQSIVWPPDAPIQ